MEPVKCDHCLGTGIVTRLFTWSVSARLVHDPETPRVTYPEWFGEVRLGLAVVTDVVVRFLELGSLQPLRLVHDSPVDRGGVDGTASCNETEMLAQLTNVDDECLGTARMDHRFLCAIHGYPTADSGDISA